MLDNLTFRIIDCETTGLDPEKDRVVEIAFQDIRLSEPNPRRTFSALVNPGIPIPPEASAIHHLTDDDVRGQRSPERILEDLAAVFPRPEASVAHNAAFDAAMLCALPGPWLCTRRLAMHLWPEAPGFGNQVLRYWLRLEVTCDAPHRALPDVLVTVALFRREIAELKARGMDLDLPGLLEFAASPCEVARIGFGKHRGTAWSEIPLDYLDWLQRQRPLDDPDQDYTLAQVWRRRHVG